MRLLWCRLCHIVSHVHAFAGTYGKFEPNQPVDVPIWLAIELRKRNQCEIRLPPWMSLQQLKEAVHKERIDMTSFQPLPFHYVEVC
jgi:GINS complex subunit 2